MAVVNTNISASIAQDALGKNERSMNTAMERLSTGKRINGAKDDAAGLAISARMTSQIRGLEAGMKNAGDAISMISVADGAMVEIGNMLQRMRELALQSANGTTTADDRDYLNDEYQSLRGNRALHKILSGTNDILTWQATKLQVGANGGQTIAVDFAAVDQTNGSAFGSFSSRCRSVDICGHYCISNHYWQRHSHQNRRGHHRAK